MKLRFAAALAAALLMSACGGGAGDSGPEAPNLGNTPPPNPAPPPDPAPTPTPQPTPPPQDKAPIPTEIGEPLGDAISKTIGAGGGELATADGAIAVVVPPGAFAKDEIVSIQEISNEAHGAKGRAFRISPEGLNTPVPMTIRFKYEDDELAGTTLESLRVAYQQADRTWRVYTQPTIDTNAKTLSIKTRHFSDWSKVVGVQILPNAARVKVGQSLNLHVLVCEYEVIDENDDLLVPMPGSLTGCEASPLNSFTTKNWAVNGVEGGSATFGTIVPNPDRWTGQAMYTAPAVKPAANVVSVSAQHDSLMDDSLHLLVSNITIDEEAASCEAFGAVEKFSAELSFDAFSFTSTAEYRRHEGRHAGRLVGTLKKVVQGPVDFGFWVTYLEPLQGGHVSINDTYSYEPPHSGGYSGSFFGEGAPYDAIDAPSFIGLKLDYVTCKFDLFGTFIVNGTITHEGQVLNTKIGAGGLAIFGHAVPAEQVTTTSLQGTLPILAIDDADERTGYVPVQDVTTNWLVTGSTTARWTITPQ